MGVLDKCGFQGKVGTTDIPAYKDLMSGAIVPLILPILTELHQSLISKEDSYTFEVLKKNAVY